MIISGGGAGSVQPGLARETEDVLQWDYGKICWGALRQAYQSPIHAVFAGANQSKHGGAFFFGERGPPAQGGVVVVGAGIDDAVCSQAMWQIGVGGGVSECELQDCHARNFVAVAQSNYVGRDQAQIFG